MAIPTANPATRITVELNAASVDQRHNLVVEIAEALPGADCITAVRIDAAGCVARMDLAARPVDPQRLH